MSSIRCPRCSEKSKGEPYRHQTRGYARCPYCNAGIKYGSDFLRQNLEPVSWYVPEGCSVSPKTGRVLCGHRVHKSGRFVSYFFKKIVGHPNPNSQSKRRGTLKQSLNKKS